MFPDCKQEDTLEVAGNYQKQVASTEGSRGIPWPVFEIRWGQHTFDTFILLCRMLFWAFTEIASIRLSVEFFIRLHWKDPRS